MKNSRVCPKCNDKNIIKIPGVTGPYGTGNNIQVGFWKGTVNVTRYLCCNCGYTEEWVDSREDINKLKEKYNK